MATELEYEVSALAPGLGRAATRRLDQTFAAFQAGLVTKDELDLDIRVYVAHMAALRQATAAVAASFERRDVRFELEQRSGSLWDQAF